MGKIDVTTAGNSSSTRKGHLESHLNGEEARKARLEAFLKNKQEPENDSSFSRESNLSKQEEKPAIGGEVRDPRIQNERIKKLLAEINDLRLENESLIEDKENLSKSLLEISKTLDKAGIKIKDGEIVETKKPGYTPSGNALRPSYAIKNRKIETASTINEEEITKAESIKQPTTLRTSSVVRLPKKEPTKVVEQEAETVTEEPKAETEITPVHDFLHPDKFIGAISAVHKTDEEDVVVRIDEAIEAEPFLPPEEPVQVLEEERVVEKPEQEHKIEEQKEETKPEPIVLDQAGNIEVLSKRSNIEKLAAVSSLVEARIKEANKEANKAANDPIMLAWSATGQLAA